MVESFPAKAFLIARHPESLANEQGVFAGGTVDVGLSPKGEADKPKLIALAQELPADLKPKRIVHTELKRTQEIAEPMGDALGVPVVAKPELKERSWGELAGKAKAPYPKHHEYRKNPPNGESKDIFYARSNAEVAKTVSEFDGLQLLIAHKGTIEGLVEVHGFELPDEPGNAVVYRFTPKKKVVAGEFPWELSQISLEAGLVKIEPVRLIKMNRDATMAHSGAG